MGPKSPIKSPNWILFLICMILEIAGLMVLALVQRSICIAAYEVSNGVMVFILFMFTAVFPDIVYVIGIIFMHDLGKEPLGIMYNLIIGLCCFAGSLFLLIVLTYCGNSAQLLILIAAILGLFAGLLHLVNFGISHWQLPAEELYVIPPVKRKI